VKKQTIYQRAMNYLARREHSEHELRNKLAKAEFSADDIDDIISKLIASNLQSDERFCESYVRYRSQRGFGSQRIRQELKERGVDTELISDALFQSEIDWFSLAMTVRSKRFGEHRPEDYKERAKQQRFLQYRGFTHEQITESFNN
jgi:regulatory protein